MFKKLSILIILSLMSSTLWAPLGYDADSGVGFSATSAESVETDTTNFDGSLSGADDEVQKALDTLDDAIPGLLASSNTWTGENTFTRPVTVTTTIYTDVLDANKVVTSTIEAKSPLRIEATEVTVPASATYDGVDVSQVQTDTTTLRTDVDDNKTVLEELSSSTLELYYTDEFTSSGEYRLMIDTVPTGAESTIISSMDSATVIVTTFTVETTLGLSALRSGLYHSHFHAELTNTNRDVRLRFEVYNGTGAAETFLFSSEQSNLITADKVAYDIHVSTIEIITAIEYLVVRIVADVIGVAAAPDLTFYMEGTNSSVFEMPALLSDVGVTKIISGTNIAISPTDGRGDVVINLDWQEDKVYYVSKDGSDTNTGEYLGDAFLTFTKAVDTVKDQSPTETNVYAIICNDAGVYTENLTVSSYTIINAPAAEISGTHTLGDCTIMRFFKNQILSSGIGFQKSVGGNCAYIYCEVIVTSGTATGVLCTAGDLIVKFNHIQNYGTGWGLASWTNDHLYARGGHIQVLGAGYGIGTAIIAGAEIDINCNTLEVTGNGGVGIDVDDATFINANIIHLEATGQTAYDVEATGELNLTVNNLSGTETNAGTANICSPAAVELLESNTGYLQTAIELLENNTGYLETAVSLLEDNTGYLESYADRIAISTGTIPNPATLVVGFTKDCDYICDGTDDEVQINAALSALKSSYSTGTVVLREGIYNVDLIETAAPNTTIIGMGASTVLNMDAATQLLEVLGTHINCKLMNLTFTASANAGLVFISASGCVIQNCFWDEPANNQTNLIIQTDGDNTLILDNRFVDTDQTSGRIIDINADDCIVANNYIESSGHGIYGLNGSDNMIVGNRIQATSTGTVLTGASATNYQIQGNNFEGCGTGIIDGGTGTRIRNNIDKNGAWLPGTEMELTQGATIGAKLKVNQITSGDAGSVGDVYTRHASSDSWADPPAGGAGSGIHSLSWHITGNPFTSSTTAKGLYQIPVVVAGTISDIYFKFGTAPSEAFTVRFKDTGITASSYENVFGTATFTVGVDSASVSGLSYSVSAGDSIGIDMYDILYSSNCGSDVGMGMKYTE